MAYRIRNKILQLRFTELDYPISILKWISIQTTANGVILEQEIFNSFWPIDLNRLFGKKLQLHVKNNRHKFLGKINSNKRH
jgi:hypothetical protein